jgi:hypothetical protein
MILENPTITNIITSTGATIPVIGGINTRSYTWVISSPATGGIPGPKIGVACTATSIHSYVTAATSATFNIEERTSIGSAGTNMLASDQVSDVTGEEATSFDNAGLAAGNWLWIDISATSGTPGNLVITLTYTIP